MVAVILLLWRSRNNKR